MELHQPQEISGRGGLSEKDRKEITRIEDNFGNPNTAVYAGGEVPFADQVWRGVVEDTVEKMAAERQQSD